MSASNSVDSSPPKVRKIRKDRKYPTNAERQKAYRLRKKVLDAYFLQLEQLDDLLLDEPLEGTTQ